MQTPHTEVVQPTLIRNAREGASADPSTTEIIRHALNSVARQMKRVLVRTAVTATIYAQADFAIALYDPLPVSYRLLTNVRATRPAPVCYIDVHGGTARQAGTFWGGVASITERAPGWDVAALMAPIGVMELGEECQCNKYP